MMVTREKSVLRRYWSKDTSYWVGRELISRILRNMVTTVYSSVFWRITELIIIPTIKTICGAGDLARP